MFHICFIYINVQTSSGRTFFFTGSVPSIVSLSTARSKQGSRGGVSVIPKQFLHEKHTNNSKCINSTDSMTACAAAAGLLLTT